MVYSGNRYVYFFVVAFLYFMSMQNFYGQRKALQMLPHFDKVKFHWGFYVGGQMANYDVLYKKTEENVEASILSKLKIGFHLGMVADWKINSYLNFMLEPGFISQSNTLEFTHIDLVVLGDPNNKNPKEDDFEPLRRNIQANYIYLPAVLKLSGGRLDNVKPYGLVGVAYGFNIASNSFEKDEFDEKDTFRMTIHNFMYELGVGMDIYFPYFKCSPSLRGFFNIRDQMIPDTKEKSAYTYPVESFKMSGLFFRLTFQ